MQPNKKELKTNIDYKGWFFKIARYCRKVFYVDVLKYLVHLKLVSHGVVFGHHINFNGFPLINRVPDSKIILGDNCEFNSSRHSQPIGLHRPCAFITLKKGAEIIIGNNSGGTGVTLAAANSIRIGNNVLIGAFCTIIDNDFHNSNPLDRKSIISKPIVIEDNVFIGMNSFILKGIVIGKNSVIGANSVVVTDVPPNSLALGNPCKIIMKMKWE